MSCGGFLIFHKACALKYLAFENDCCTFVAGLVSLLQAED